MIAIDGKKIRKEILETVKEEVALLPFTPVFCDVLVGDDPASVQYVAMKAKIAESVGMSFHRADFSVSITTLELVREIQKLNEVEHMCGIIVQLPLPEHIDKQKVFDSIDPKLDVDCLGTSASERFYSGDVSRGFPAALSCMVLLDSLSLDNNPSTSLGTQKIAVLGQGKLVGKPVTALLKFRGYEPYIITEMSGDKEKHVGEADVIITGIGKGKYITGDMIKKGAILIDAGTSEDNGSIVGDVDQDSVSSVAGYLSPVPGGVGPVTVAILLRNVAMVAKELPSKAASSVV